MGVLDFISQPIEAATQAPVKTTAPSILAKPISSLNFNALATKPVVPAEPSQTQTFSDKVISTFPFTDSAKATLQKIPVTVADPANRAAPSQTEFGTNNLPTGIVINSTQTPDDQYHLSNEFFNTLFSQDKIDPAAFNTAWEQAKKQDPRINTIDKTLNDPKNATVFKGSGGRENITDPFYLATERFAHAGAMIGVDGISAIPPALQKFYASHLKDFNSGDTLVKPPASNLADTVLGAKPAVVTNANSTAPVVNPSTPNPADLIIGKNTVRAPFEAPADAGQIGGGKITAAVVNTLSRIAELPFKALAQGIENIHKTDAPGNPDTLLPIAPEQLGLQSTKTGAVQDSGTNFMNALTKIGYNFDNPSASDVIRGTWEALKGPLSDVLDLFGTESLIKGGATEVLAKTGYSPTVSSGLQKLGLSGADDVSLQTIKEAALKKAQNIIEYHGGTMSPTGAAQGLPPAAVQELSELGQATHDVLTAITGKGIPKLNTLGKIAESTARALTEDVGGIGRNTAEMELGQHGVTQPEKLPGYRATQPDIHPFGASTQEVEPVGFKTEPNNEGQVIKIFDRKAPVELDVYSELNKLYRSGQNDLGIERVKDLPRNISGENAISKIMFTTAGEGSYDTMENIAASLIRLGYKSAPNFDEKIEIPDMMLNGQKLPKPILESDLLSFYMNELKNSPSFNESGGIIKLGNTSAKDFVSQPIRAMSSVTKTPRSPNEFLQRPVKEVAEEHAQTEVAKNQSTTPDLSKITEQKNNTIHELKVQHDNLKEQIKNNPAQALKKYVSPTTGRLPEVTSTPGTTGKYGRFGDDIAQSLGFKDTGDAQLHLDNLTLQEKRLAETKANLSTAHKDLKNTSLEDKEAKSLNHFLKKSFKGSGKEEHPGANLEEANRLGYDADTTKRNFGVMPPEVRGGIKAPELDFTKWKDKSLLAMNRDTFERNLEKVAPREDAEKVKKFITDPVQKNETDKVRAINAERKELKAKLREFNIKPGSTDDELIQLLGEGKANLEQARASSDNVENIQRAITFFRNKYDEFIDKWNLERAKYNLGPIPKRDDYFRHFNDINFFTQNFGFLRSAKELPTSITGETQNFKPNKPFSTAELHRTGDKTSYSAVRGFDNYIDSVFKQIYHINSVQRGRAIQKYLNNVAKASEAAGKPIQLQNFKSNLKEYIDAGIAGKQGGLDRGIEQVVGRSWISRIKKLEEYIGRNIIAGNIASAMSHLVSIPLNAATVDKVPLMQGILTTLTSPLHKDPYNTIDGVESDFLTRRYPEKAVAPKWWTKVESTLNFVMETADKMKARIAVSSKYFEGISNGLPKEAAMHEADNYAGRIIGDPTTGSRPNIFMNRTATILAQFQLGMNDGISVLMHDIPYQSEGKKTEVVSKLVQFAIYSYLLNQMYKHAKGSGKGIDPIDWGLTLTGLNEEGAGQTLLSRIGLTAADVSGELPFLSLFTGQFPVAQSFQDVSSGIGKAATDLSTGGPWWQDLIRPASETISPIGGGVQTTKTIEGIRDFMRGYGTSGSTVYPVDRTPFNAVKEILFGPSSSENSPNNTTDDSVIAAVLLYAKAMKTDPATAFNRIFTGQKITRIANDAIVVQRMSLAASTKVKQERGGDNSSMKLDHTIPLEIGGSNSPDNLKLVTTDQWASYTPVEDLLGRLLNADKISKDEAQKDIIDFKNGEITAQSLFDKYGVDAKNLPALSDTGLEDQNSALDTKTFDTLAKQSSKQQAVTSAQFKNTFDQIQGLIQSGATDKAQEMVDGLSDDDYAIYKKMKATSKAKDTAAKEVSMMPTVKQVQSLVKAGKQSDAQAIIDGMSDDDYKIYQLAKKRLGIK